MSLINYFFGYPGALTVPADTEPENLKMASGVATGSGYLLPRSYVVNSVTATWSAATVAGTITIQILSGEVEIDTIEIDSTNYDDLADTVSPAYALGAESYIRARVYGTDTNSISDLQVTIELSTTSAAGDADDVLPNIAITTADLQTVKPNITQYLKDGETDFEDIVLNQKQELYAEIKRAERQNYSGYTNAELDTKLAKIRDYPKEANLANRLKYQIVGWILMDNRLYDEADYFIQHAKSIPMEYYIDDDADSAAADDEQSKAQAPRFGR